MSYTDVFGSSTVPPAQESLSQVVLSSNKTLSWPEDPVTDDIVGAITEVNASGLFNLTLPDARRASVGKDILLRNTGIATFTLLDASGATVTTIASGVSKFVYLASNSTEAGSWMSFTYGATTATTVASDLAGAGMQANSGLLDLNATTRGITGADTIVVADRAKLILASGGTYSISLPTAASVGNGFFFNISNSGAGSITVDPNGAETIDGQSTRTLVPKASFICFSDGAAWYTVGAGSDVIFAFSEYSITTTSGSITLSASDVAGKMIKVQNPLVGNLTVNLPAAASVYYVNSTSWGGGYYVKYQVIGAPGTSVQVTTGQAVTLYSDATNISLLNTAVTSTTIALNDGSAAAPILYFSSDTDTGFYRAGANQLGVATGGAQRALFTDSGVSIPGELSIVESVDTVYSLAGTDIDPANGNIQHKTFSGNVTFTESLVSGQSVLLVLTDADAHTVTWPTITWVSSTGNAAPTLTAKDVVVLWKVSTTLYGVYTGSGV